MVNIIEEEERVLGMFIKINVVLLLKYCWDNFYYFIFVMLNRI